MVLLYQQQMVPISLHQRSCKICEMSVQITQSVLIRSLRYTNAICTHRNYLRNQMVGHFLDPVMAVL